MSIRAKLTALFVIPLSVFLIVSALQIIEATQRANNISNLEKLSQLAIHISALIHETQKERGASGIFLASQGEKFSSELQQ